VQDNKRIVKIILSLTRCPLCFHPYPLFQWYPQCKEILLNLKYEMLKLSIWCTSSRVIVVVVQVGAVKIYVEALDAFGKKERGDETQLTTKIGGKTSLGPSCFVL
jgi:hypothetical protein